MSQKKLYDNITLLSHDDNFIGYISKKKTNWCLNKNLGNMINDTTCKLNFKGNFKGETLPSNIFKQTNNCVICDTETNLTKFSLIHKDIKKILPQNYRSRRSHAILPVCTECRSDVDSIMAEEIKEVIGFDSYTNYHQNIKKYADKIIHDKISPYDLEKIWANKFYEIFEPQHLPNGWSEFFEN